MRILYIYRHPSMGFSIGKVFKPIEEEMKRYAEVDSIELPAANYSLRSLWRNIRYAQCAVKQKKYDIVHITGSEHYLIPFLRKQKVVVTVHDLGSIRKNKRTIRQVLKNKMFISSLKYASFVTFISEKSRTEALSLVKLKDSKIVVVPDAVDKSYVSSPKVINSACPIILHIGTKDNKNLFRVIEALSNIKCLLRIIGSLSSEQLQALESSDISYTNALNLTDAEIYEEYVRCDVVSFPSLYEGFGMPIIEGQSVGRVVVTSDLSPMREVAGNGAVLVGPYDVDSIRTGFEEAISNYSEYVSAGYANVAKYSVESVTEQYYNVYKFVCHL